MCQTANSAWGLKRWVTASDFKTSQHFFIEKFADLFPGDTL